MIKYLFLFVCCLSCFGWADKPQRLELSNHFEDEPIDVVIVAHPKDKETLDLCIDGIKENCHQVRRVIVVSSEKFTHKAEWFNENQFPFSKAEVALAIVRGNKKEYKKFSQRQSRGPGWYFQQLLKLYAPFIIPGISSNVLIIDADTIFLNSVDFLNRSFGGLFCVGHQEVNDHYFKHAKRLVPGYKRIYPELYSVCHHMLFQKLILKNLFKAVENKHHTSFWRAFCLCIDPKAKAASEYEIYYNYALTHIAQVEVRELKWANSAYVDERHHFKQAGYHFVSFHTYMRGKWPRTYDQ